MKNIKLSDQDYKKLMELSKELQLQECDHQAHPKYWDPRSRHRVLNPNDEGEFWMIYDEEESEALSLEAYAEYHSEIYDQFMTLHLDDDRDKVDMDYDPELEQEWWDFLKEDLPYEKRKNLRFFSEDLVPKVDHNPSFFKSDVRGYIETNKHHLGGNPQTWANTIQRMPKMQNLLEILCRLNPQASESLDTELRRVVYPDKQGDPK